MNEDTAGFGTAVVSDATVLLNLDGLAVQAVRREADGAPVAHLVTADETAAACPECGVLASRVKEHVTTGPRDLPRGPERLRLVWHKRRWHCDQPECARVSFTESIPAVPARARLTGRLRSFAGDLVGDGICATVSAAGRAVGLSWPTTMDAVRAQAGALADDDPAPVDVLGIDEVRRGRPRWRAPDPPADPPSEATAGEPAAGGEPTVGCPPPGAEPAKPPAVSEPAKARVTADRWHVGFTDLGGGQGMLAQIEGRTADDVAYWLAAQPAAWRDRIRYVAIDMCTVFLSAIRRYLPHARVVVDHFHLVQLATDAVADVRRRITMTTRGRRGRDSDPEWKLRNLLPRNHENLTKKAFTKLWNTLTDLGDPGLTILSAWIAKEELRSLLALARTRPDRHLISKRLTRFYTWCADSGIGELHRLAATIDRWWPYIENFLHTKITNAASEGYNRLVKLDARNAFGYRNPTNQRYGHAASPPGEAAAAWTPVTFEEPSMLLEYPAQNRGGHRRTVILRVVVAVFVPSETVRVTVYVRLRAG